MPELDLPDTDTDVEAVAKWIHDIAYYWMLTHGKIKAVRWERLPPEQAERYRAVVRKMLADPHPLLVAAALRGPGPITKAVEW